MKRLKKFFSSIGPGFVTGASDDDPSGIGTYSQTGAMFGYAQLWTAFFSFPFMTAVQEMCARIGIVTGKGLASVIRTHYPKQVLFIVIFLLSLANTINIGADLGAMAGSAQLLFDLPFSTYLILFTVVSILLQVLIPYKLYASILKYFSFTLLAYVIAAFAVDTDWQAVFLATIRPQIIFTQEYLMNIVAILGTTISPYLFFWQTSEEVEEEVDKRKLKVMGQGTPKFTKMDIFKARRDTIMGMFFSNLVMFFIILTTAGTLSSHGITNIETADQAAEALRPIAGDFAYLLFASGIIGTGFLALPVLAGSTAYAFSETFRWKEGLYRKFGNAIKFYLVIITSMVIGFFINYFGIAPFKLLYYTAIFNGICAPPLLFFILQISNNKNIMGKYTNGLLMNILGWAITAIMAIAAIALFGTMFS